MRIKTKLSISSILNFLFIYTLLIQGIMSLLNLPQLFLYIKDVLLMVALFLSLIQVHRDTYPSVVSTHRGRLLIYVINII